MGSIGFDTRTPIIGHLVIQNLPTSVCPWTGTDGSWLFLSSPFSGPQGSACRKITMIFRLCLGSEAALSVLTANAEQGRKRRFPLSWQSGWSQGQTQRRRLAPLLAGFFWLENLSFLISAVFPLSSALSNSLFVPPRNCLLFHSWLRITPPLNCVWLEQRASQREKEGLLCFLVLHLWF